MNDLDTHDLALLRAFAGAIIPSSSTYRIPGADDAQIFADACRSLSARGFAPGPMLGLLRDAGLTPSEAPALEPLLAHVRAGEPAGYATFITAITHAYYRDDRILVSLGMEARAPFPTGNTVKEGDWSLLGPVRASPPIWRQPGDT